MKTLAQFDGPVCGLRESGKNSTVSSPCPRVPTCPGNFLKVSMWLLCPAKNMDVDFRPNFMTHVAVVPLPKPHDGSFRICDGGARKAVARVKNDTLGHLGVNHIHGYGSRDIL